MDKELLYNQSGAKDITAYTAIINIQNRKDTGNMNGYEINKGEIWEVSNGVHIKQVVILKCFDRYAATVMLQEEEPQSNAVAIRTRGLMYADAGRLGFVFYDRMLDFVRALTESEERELRQAIGEALDLEVNKVSAATIAEALEARDKAREAARQYENMAAAAEAKVEEMHRNLAGAKEIIEKKEKELEEAYDHMEANAARVDELESLATSLRKQLKEDPEMQAQALKEAREDMVVARREAEIYKELYENMLDRTLALRRGKAD